MFPHRAISHTEGSVSCSVDACTGDVDPCRRPSPAHVPHFWAVTISRPRAPGPRSYPECFKRSSHSSLQPRKTAEALRARDCSARCRGFTQRRWAQPGPPEQVPRARAASWHMCPTVMSSPRSRPIHATSATRCAGVGRPWQVTEPYPSGSRRPIHQWHPPAESGRTRTSHRLATTHCASSGRMDGMRTILTDGPEICQISRSSSDRSEPNGNPQPEVDT